MKALLQILLICFAVRASAQILNLPPRATNAPDGDAFAKTLSALDLSQRDRAVADQFLAGNVPNFLRHFCPIATATNFSSNLNSIPVFFAAPDYLAIGSDENYFLVSITPGTAQFLADQSDCVLPTRKMVDAIYAAAEVKLAPMPIPPNAAMTTVPVFIQHNHMVRMQRMALISSHPLGALVAGHQKDVVISARLAGVTNKVAIYGWHQTNGVPIQPLFLGHASWWVDYSQCIRLVAKKMLVNGKMENVADVLADSNLCSLISDEGVITNARYSTNVIAPPVAEKIDLPWPEKFTASPGFGEWTREIKLPDGIRILLDAPAAESFSPDKPVLLTFYALPNGSTIEQTIGHKLHPGDDFHFDIQHIGAQTRWLRQVLTNDTLVVVYLEAATRSWPAWRKTHDDRRIAEVLGQVRNIFPTNRQQVVLAGHSGGGGLMFGYLNTVAQIPGDVKRIAFLDSDYDYDTAKYAGKIKDWLAASPENHLCVLAYQDYLARYNGKSFVSEAGGTWGRSRAMLGDLSAAFAFTSRTNVGLETYSTPDRQIEFDLKENPDGTILHTVQVERNGFIQALLAGTPAEGRDYEYLGERAYTDWIQP